MPRSSSLFCLLLCLLLSVGAAPSKEERAAKEKAVRMKTSRQLKEILTELKIKVPKGADKEDLQDIALKHDAIAKWEELHPDKKKKPRPRGGAPGGAGQQSMGDMLFPMMDKDGDGKLTLAEFQSIGGGGSPEDAVESFRQMDEDSDGSVSRAEAEAFFTHLQSMGAFGGPGGAGMGGGMPNQPDPPMADYDSDVVEDPDDTGEDDDDAPLPAQDEL